MASKKISKNFIKTIKSGTFNSTGGGQGIKDSQHSTIKAGELGLEGINQTETLLIGNDEDFKKDIVDEDSNITEDLKKCILTIAEDE